MSTTTSRAVRTCIRALTRPPAGSGPYCRCGCAEHPGRPCVRCGHRPRPNGSGLLARGLCGRCWHEVNDRGELADCPRPSGPVEQPTAEGCAFNANGEHRWGTGRDRDECADCDAPRPGSRAAGPPEDVVERCARATCEAWLDLTTELPESVKAQCAYNGLASDGKDVWRKFARRVLAAAALSPPTQEGNDD